MEEIPQQQHSFNPRQLAIKSRLIVQLQQEHRLRLPALKNTHHNKDLTQIIADINKVLRTTDTATIEEKNQLLYSTAVVVTEKLGYKMQSNRTPTQDTPPKNGKLDFIVKLTSGGLTSVAAAWSISRMAHCETKEQ